MSDHIYEIIEKIANSPECIGDWEWTPDAIRAVAEAAYEAGEKKAGEAYYERFKDEDMDHARREFAKEALVQCLAFNMTVEIERECFEDWLRDQVGE